MGPAEVWGRVEPVSRLADCAQNQPFLANQGADKSSPDGGMFPEVEGKQTSTRRARMLREKRQETGDKNRLGGSYMRMHAAITTGRWSGWEGDGPNMRRTTCTCQVDESTPIM